MKRACRMNSAIQREARECDRLNKPLARAAKKPRNLRRWWMSKNHVYMASVYAKKYLTPRECRIIAAWLLRAAAWLEAQPKRSKP